ncbi:enoyl-CoA hydratase/isomerase family protein [Ottowia thiooxydans]|uniref:2-(1,2-epoxy-1,2-dihydrophenyl)acetyl-CoA isomerase n=1 Tax=Ottowia thiooxydans TaxID=219182 RepID=A0ABV2QA74_9BURK
MSNDSSVRVDLDQSIATITLSRPQSFNSLDYGTLEALRQAFEQTVVAPGVRAIVLRGEGRSFSGGGDVMAMHDHADDLPGFIGRMIESFHATVMVISRAKVPVIASVQGAIAGGGISLALACDLVLAARGTRFVTAYAQLGASSDGGLSFRLMQRVGSVRAFELLTLHDTLSAEQAHELGLINAVVDDDSANAQAQLWAHKLAALAPQAVAEFKQLITVQSRDALQAQLDREMAAFQRCAGGEDFARRVAAFASRGATRSKS